MGPGPGPDGLMPAGYYPPRSGQPGPSGTTNQSSPISGYILGLVTKFNYFSELFLHFVHMCVFYQYKIFKPDKEW